MKEILIRAYIKNVTKGNPAEDKEGEGEIVIDRNKSEDISESFELLGVYEFVRREFGDKTATFLAMKICYTDKGLFIQHKILRRKGVFQIKDICDKMIVSEMKKIHKRLEIKKE